MSKNNTLLLLLVLVCCYIFRIFISSEIPQTLNISYKVENGVYSSLATSFNGEANVYICKGPGSKRYHYKKNCRGLKSCSTKIYKVSLSKAKELRRTLCGWED